MAKLRKLINICYSYHLVYLSAKSELDILLLISVLTIEPSYKRFRGSISTTQYMHIAAVNQLFLLIFSSSVTAILNKMLVL